jgi:hypothetical protein
MKFLRTLILLLLCAVLPISGLAASGLAGECPMQQSTPMPDDGAVSVDMHGCDMMKSSMPGKAKGQFASIYYAPVKATVSHPMAVSNQLAFHYAESFAGRVPGGLWRPPRTI